MNDKANYEIEVWMINEDCNWNSPEAKKDVVEEMKSNLDSISDIKLGKWMIWNPNGLNNWIECNKLHCRLIN